jgi:hypothetical protein
MTNLINRDISDKQILKRNSLKYLSELSISNWRIPSLHSINKVIQDWISDGHFLFLQFHNFLLIVYKTTYSGNHRFDQSITLRITSNNGDRLSQNRFFINVHSDWLEQLNIRHSHDDLFEHWFDCHIRFWHSNNSIQERYFTNLRNRWEFMKCCAKYNKVLFTIFWTSSLKSLEI